MLIKLIRAILLISLTLPLYCNGEESVEKHLKTANLPPGIQRVLNNYTQAWSKKDATMLSSLFTHDGFVLPNNQPPVRGRAAIKEYYQKAGGPLYLRAIAYKQADDIAFVIGGYAEAKGKPELGKFTLSLQKINNTWFIFSDMDNRNKK